MSDILDKIIATKHEEVRQRQAAVSIEELRARAGDIESPRGFATALKNAVASGKAGVIAEIKKASPSKGVIREHFDPVAIANSYANNGATCLSVLTDQQYFQGKDQFLVDARNAVSLPVIRKDFIVDEYQIYEARALGADCILLIMAVLDIMDLTVFNQTAKNIGLDVLIEVHNKSELQAALSQQPALIGINNRNLKTFETDLQNTLSLLEHIPQHITVVTESGISSNTDIQLMRKNGVHCFLVGEAFMRAPDPGQALKTLFF
ncbi:MAG: indole-3-glycerol phosphate synthase TrpC [Gammaproteobacteria bacterium]|nr:indole-3-glycerol phosphate synthase TrpC [Gammaproteobacteria bacterium]